MTSRPIPSLTLFLGIICVVLALASVTGAAPPANSTGEYHNWFQSLRQPETGMSCCSISDCRPVDYRATGGGYEVMIEGRWMPVPPQRVLERTDNPLGRGVVCYTPTQGIMCFVRTTES